jgi:hypothetical protein
MGRILIRAKEYLPEERFKHFCARTGYTAGTICTYMQRAQNPDWKRAPKKTRESAERQILEALIQLADRAGAEAAIERAREILSNE